jgi:hypothetical protein
MGCNMQFSRKKPMFLAIQLPLGVYTLKSEASLSTEIEVPLQNYTRTLLHLRTLSSNTTEHSLRDPGSTMPYGINIAISTLAEVFPCFFLSCKANSMV